MSGFPKRWRKRTGFVWDGLRAQNVLNWENYDRLRPYSGNDLVKMASRVGLAWVEHSGGAICALGVDI